MAQSDNRCIVNPNMLIDSRTVVFVVLVTSALLLGSQTARGQATCLTAGDITRMVVQVNAPRTMPLNKKLRNELLKLREREQERFQNSLGDGVKSEALLKQIQSSKAKTTVGLCRLLKEFGWPTTDVVGNEGEAAAFLLLKNSSSSRLQLDLLPVIVAVAKKGEILKPEFASYFDHLRLSIGEKQLFGTQATIQDGFLMLFPIEDETRVDARRKQYELPPLGDYLKNLQIMYRLPLIKATGKLTNSFVRNPTTINKKTALNLFVPQLGEEDEVIRTNTNLVNLNVSVYNGKLKSLVSTFEQKDFSVSEDGHEEKISFFAKTDVPFDLVLLIDLSGSTSGKRDLIRKTTQRFIAAARPADRLAIVTFADTTNVVSPLTDNREQLLASAARIDGTGNSKVWDALKFTLDEVLGPKPLERRRAVIFMTDGVDNALMNVPDAGSTITFADLVEAVRRNDTLIIPICLDTENDAFGPMRTTFDNARKTLALLADESGGLFYKARKIEDLNGVYDQVIEDLGKVYSLGYKPTNDKRDGSWRSVKIQIPGRPDLLTRARPGYYAN
jgi:VWFA-related protein